MFVGFRGDYQRLDCFQVGCHVIDLDFLTFREPHHSLLREFSSEKCSGMALEIQRNINRRRGNQPKWKCNNINLCEHLVNKTWNSIPNNKHVVILKFLQMFFLALRFYCTTCNRSYKYKAHLTSHLKYECGKLPQFECSRCSKRFFQKFLLHRHYKFTDCTKTISDFYNAIKREENN